MGASDLATTETEFDLFLSFQGADEDFARRLADAIKHAGGGLKVFFAPSSVAVGANIVLEIDRALATARYFGLILSPEYISADWPTGESSAAIWADPGGRLGRVIPILYKRCQIPPLLRFRKYVDFERLSFDLGVQQIVSFLRGTTVEGLEVPTVGTRGIAPTSRLDASRNLLDGVKPDPVTDNLFLNIFPVVKSPRYIWNAPTKVKSRGDLFRYYGQDRIVPPFILADGRLYTFTELSAGNHPFVGVIEDYDISRETWDSWIRDVARSKRLHWLLDDCLREKTRSLRLTYEPKGKRFYYEQGVLREQKFRAFARGKGKDFVIDYTERGGTYVAHRAVQLRFILLGSEPFLRVESGWVFTDAAGETIEGRRRAVLNAKFTSGQRNASNFNEVRFWLWFFAGDAPTLRLGLGGGEFLDVRVDLNPIEVNFGILGDNRSLSPVRGAPDVVFEAEAEATDEGDIESFDEDEPE